MEKIDIEEVGLKVCTKRLREKRKEYRDSVE